jgi:hypothetical protein
MFRVQHLLAHKGGPVQKLTKLALALIIVLLSTSVHGQSMADKVTSIIGCMMTDSCKAPTTEIHSEGTVSMLLLPFSMTNEKQEMLVLSKGSFSAREQNMATGIVSHVIDYGFDGVIDGVQIMKISGEIVAYFPVERMTPEERVGFQKYFDDAVNQATLLGLVGYNKKRT